MHKARNFAASTMLAAGLMVGGHANADVTATAQTDIEVNFPEILVMYTFSDVTLAPDATFLTTALGLGTGGSCSAGDDCVDAGATGSINVTTASTDLDIASDADVPADTALNDIVLTLENAVGARSLGLTDANYTLGVTEAGTTAVLNVETGTQPTSFTNNGLVLSTSDLVLEIDVSEIAGTVGSRHLLLAAEEITGQFENISMIGLGDAQDALLTIDYANDTVILEMLQPGQGTGALSLDIYEDDGTDATSSTELWDALTDGQPVAGSDELPNLFSDEEEMPEENVAVI